MPKLKVSQHSNKSYSCQKHELDNKYENVEEDDYEVCIFYALFF